MSDVAACPDQVNLTFSFVNVQKEKLFKIHFYFADNKVNL